MAQTAGRPAWGGVLGMRMASLSGVRLLDLASLASVSALAFALSAWGLDENGWGNTYYAAAVRSMSGSWHNFFFASFDPGGFISVDKPPVFLWIGALSVRMLGYNSWALLLPSAIAGTATVALTWWVTRRLAGVLSATVAGLVLAFTPVTVAVDRLNLPEPFLILALLGAAAATLRSLDSRRWWAWTIAAGVLVGVAFNIKMLAGWIPGPALALALVFGDGDTFRLNVRRAAARLAILAAATFIVSASWMVVVDAWPAGSRPYVGGSTDNSVSNLAFDYNGLGRVEGQSGRPGGNPQPPANNNGNTQRPGNGALPNSGGFGGPQPNGGVPGGGNGAGGIIAGTPGLWRMFDDANGGQIAWFLPFALLGSVICLWRWPKDRVRRAAVVLFAGWVLLFGIVFSYAEGTYHSYYTSAMAPGVAILVGLTIAAGADLVRRDARWLAAMAVPLLATAWVQLTLAGRFPGFRDQLEPLAIVLVAAGAALAIGTLAARRIPLQAGLAVAVAGLLVLPASWATYEATHPSMNTTLPQAGPREGSAGRSFGSEVFDEGSDALAAWLEAHHDAGSTWDLAVPSAQNASALMAEHDLSIMSLGGFMGSDPTITAGQFADLVAAGEVRYVLVSGAGGGFRAPAGGVANRGPQRQFPGGAIGGGPQANGNTKGAAAIESAARALCTPVSSPDVPAQYRGAIYDCTGKADALRQLG